MRIISDNQEIPNLIDLLKTMRNRIDIVLFLIEHNHYDPYMFTLLEDNYETCVEIVDGYCIQR